MDASLGRSKALGVVKLVVTVQMVLLTPPLLPLFIELLGLILG